MYACTHEVGSDFSRWCTVQRIGQSFLATHPAALPFANVSMPAPRTENLTAVNRDSTAQYLVPGGKPQGEAVGNSSPLYWRGNAGWSIWRSENASSRTLVNKGKKERKGRSDTPRPSNGFSSALAGR